MADRARHFHLARQYAVIPGRRTLHGEDIEPPRHHALRFGEEAVPADIHAVPVVARGAGIAADFSGGFKNNRGDVGFIEQLVRGGEPRRPGADNQGGFLLHKCVRPLR